MAIDMIDGKDDVENHRAEYSYGEGRVMESCGKRTS